MNKNSTINRTKWRAGCYILDNGTVLDVRNPIAFVTTKSDTSETHSHKQGREFVELVVYSAVVTEILLNYFINTKGRK